ncbi:unnamed protein product [Ectocarpus sp. 12 AP-2014]
MARMAMSIKLMTTLAQSWIQPLRLFRNLWLCAHKNQKPVALDCQAAVGYPLTLHLSPWQSEIPFSWVSLVNGERVASGEFLAPLGIGWELLSTDAETLMSGMPEAVRSVIQAAPFLGVELAQVCGQVKAAQDLASSSPLILILLVERGVHESWSREAFVRLLAKRQAIQCSAIGLTKTKACAKLLRRCELSPMIRRDLSSVIRTLQRSEDMALLRHHSSVSIVHLLFLARYDGIRWPGLLELINDCLASQPPCHGAITWLQHMLTDTSRMLTTTSSALDRVRSTADLQSLHDRLVQRFNADLKNDNRHSIELERRHGDYPSPPLLGTETITPITSWQALLIEGQCMMHCVGSYDRAVALRHLAIYHMHYPQSVTIAIAPQGKRWSLSQARGVRNTMISAESQEAIQKWLETASPASSN